MNVKTVFVVAIYNIDDEVGYFGAYDTIEQARADGIKAFKQFFPRRWARVLDNHNGDIDEAESVLLYQAETLSSVWGLVIQELPLNRLMHLEY